MQYIISILLGIIIIYIVIKDLIEITFDDLSDVKDSLEFPNRKSRYLSRQTYHSIKKIEIFMGTIVLIDILQSLFSIHKSKYN